jgi:hypothetical protein
VAVLLVAELITGFIWCHALAMTAKCVRFLGPPSNNTVPPRHCEERGWGSDEARLTQTFAGLLRGVAVLLVAELITGFIWCHTLAMTAKMVRNFLGPSSNST